MYVSFNPTPGHVRTGNACSGTSILQIIKTATTDLVLERLRERDLLLFLLGASFDGAGAGSASTGFVSTLSWRAKFASLTFLSASSTSLLVSEGEGPWGFTIAFLLWLTLVRERERGGGGGRREREGGRESACVEVSE